MSTSYTSGWRDDEVAALGELADKFFAKMVVPQRDRFDAQQHVDREVWLEAGRLGLLCCSIPEQYGGGGGSFAHDLAVLEAQSRALDSGWGNAVHSGIVAHYLLAYGTEEQRKRWLPKMARGEMIAAIAMTEPGTGSDLKNIKTTALRDGDEYVINGAKIFTSLAGDADYIWLATRTDPNVPKHKGISMFLVPMDTPGIRVVPMKLLGDHNINYTFYEDVRVPATALVGGENQGWNLITNQLNHERVTLCAPGIIERVLADVRAWAQATKLPDGRRVVDQEWVQEHLARVYAELEFLRLINWKVAWQATQGHLEVADASTIKVFGTEFYLRAFRLLMEIIGQAGYLTRGSPAAVIAGRLEMYARSMIILTFGGGTNEIQRDLIAIFGLGMPRSLR